MNEEFDEFSKRRNSRSAKQIYDAASLFLNTRMNEKFEAIEKAGRTVAWRKTLAMHSAMEIRPAPDGGSIVGYLADDFVNPNSWARIDAQGSADAAAWDLCLMVQRFARQFVTEPCYMVIDFSALRMALYVTRGLEVIEVLTVSADESVS